MTQREGSHEYRSIKAKIKKVETTNFDKIILIPCSGNSNWYEIAEHSALFYYYKVCKKLGISANFAADTNSYVVQYDIGLIRCYGPDTVRKRLKLANLYRGERTQDGCIIFELTTKSSAAEIQELQARETTRRTKNNSIVKITHSDPVFHQHLVGFFTRLNYACSKQLSKFDSATIGVDMQEKLHKLILDYYACCTKKTASISLEEWNAFGSVLKQLLYDIEFASEVKLWPRKICLDLGNLVIAAEKHVAMRINNINKTRNNSCKTNSPAIETHA